MLKKYTKGEQTVLAPSSEGMRVSHNWVKTFFVCIFWEQIKLLNLHLRMLARKNNFKMLEKENANSQRVWPHCSPCVTNCLAQWHLLPQGIHTRLWEQSLCEVAFFKGILFVQIHSKYLLYLQKACNEDISSWYCNHFD